MGHRQIYEELVALFRYNPPLTRLSDESGVTFSYPNVFYDRHLHPWLSLKHVKVTPPISLEIAQLVLDELKILKSKDQLLPPIHSGRATRFSTREGRETHPPDTTLWDATSVAQFYRNVSYEICSPVASTIALHPHAETWLTALDLCAGSEPRRPAMVSDYILKVYHHHSTGELTVPREILSSLSNDLRRDLKTISDRFPTLATFQFHTPLTAVEEIFGDMGAIAKKNRNKALLLQCSAVDPVLPPQDVPLTSYDSLLTIESLPCIMTSFPENRRSTRLNSQKERRPVVPKKASQSKVWPTLTMKRPKAATPDSTLLLQHAWTQAVQSDTTVIVFHCGNFERIGFRHRNSQTLCLSDLIDVSECPNYGQIQVGLYMIILRDALDRIRQINTKSEMTTRTKRKEIDSTNYTNPTRRSKRRRTTASRGQELGVESIDDAQSVLLRETSRRNLALLRLQYGVFNSPGPAVLYRVGCAASPDTEGESLINYPRKRTYTPDEYFRITLTSDIAEGATGKVHDAIIEVQVSKGHIQSCAGVVKIALERRKREKLRHEYAVYRYMASKKVKHVAVVYGLFEDAADEAMILVMSHAGTSLVRQPHYRECKEVSLTEQEQEAFKVAMTEIHNAGVRHYDIRPENLMMDDQGRATIIDFDMAKVKAGRRSRQRELTHLCSLLEGDYDPPNQGGSPRTSASAESPPADDDILQGRI